jgi:hypothetical protein
VVASLSRGAFRFVGARTSQTEGGAIVRTPVATVGIRGAVSNIAYDPATREAFAALVAGNALTITDGDGTTRIVYEIGYTAVIVPDGAGGTTTTIRKSTAAEARAFLDQLAGKPGTSGGSSNQPGDSDVAGSGVPQNNSGLPDIMFVPGSLNPTSTGDFEELAGLDEAVHDDFITFSDPGDLYDLGNLPFGGVATYTGLAQGTVTRSGEGGPITTNATGDFSMTFDFGAREGLMEISNFDNIYASGWVDDFDGDADFSGPLWGIDGENYYDELSGETNGSFLSVGSQAGAGVIGTFSLSDYYGSVSAVGSFTGAGAPGEFPSD